MLPIQDTKLDINPILATFLTTAFVLSPGFNLAATSKLGGWYCYATFADRYRQAYINQLNKNYQNIPLLSCEPAKTKKPGLLLPRRSWLRYPLMATPDPRVSISIPLLFVLPTLIFFAVCYTLYSKKEIICFVGLYTLVLFATIHNAARKFAGSQVEAFLWNWGLQESLIMELLGMFVVMVLLALTVRAGIYLNRKFNDNANVSKPHADYDQRILVFYLLSNIIFTTLTITLLVGIAQQRYRFYVDGLYLILLSLFIQTIIFPFAGKVRRLLHQCTATHSETKK